MSTFQILFGVGVLFVCLQAIVSFYLNQIGPKNLISKIFARSYPSGGHSIFVWSFSNLADLVVAELDWNSIFNGILRRCDSNRYIHELLSVRVNHECDFSEFVHHEYSGNGNVLHLHVWTSGWVFRQQFSRSNVGKPLYDHFLHLRSSAYHLYWCLRHDPTQYKTNLNIHICDQQLQMRQIVNNADSL